MVLAPVCTPHNTCFLGPTPVFNPNGILIGSAVFAQLKCPHTLQWAAIPPVKIASFHGRSGSHLIYGCLDPPDSSVQTASRLIHPFLQGSLVWHTDRPTDHATLCNNHRPHRHVRSTAMRPNNMCLLTPYRLILLEEYLPMVRVHAVSQTVRFKTHTQWTADDIRRCMCTRKRRPESVCYEATWKLTSWLLNICLDQQSGEYTLIGLCLLVGRSMLNSSTSQDCQWVNKRIMPGQRWRPFCPGPGNQCI